MKLVMACGPVDRRANWLATARARKKPARPEPARAGPPGFGPTAVSPRAEQKYQF
jgi:hypothetical protein